MSTWSQLQADKAFTAAARARRRARIACRLRGGGSCIDLTVYEGGAAATAAPVPASRGVRDIPLEAIRGTLEPNRAAHFDPAFRPAVPTRHRWQSVWLAEERGTPLPPITVVPVTDGYAVKDGHHRVSVARARGAVSITALVSAA